MNLDSLKIIKNINSKNMVNIFYFLKYVNLFRIFDGLQNNRLNGLGVAVLKELH